MDLFPLPLAGGPGVGLSHRFPAQKFQPTPNPSRP
jgi:hypothetical protein